MISGKIIFSAKVPSKCPLKLAISEGIFHLCEKNLQKGVGKYRFPGCLLYTSARLDSYLADLNEQAQERFELIETQMRSAEGVSEELKRQNPMEWLCHCNNIRNRAAEIIKQELIYV